MQVIEFKPKHNHIAADKYVSMVSKEVRRRTGVRCTVEYRFPTPSCSKCDFSITLSDQMSPQHIPQLFDVFWTGTVSASAVSAMVQTAQQSILQLVEIVYNQAPQMSLCDTVSVLGTILGDRIEDRNQLQQFIVDSLTGRTTS